MKIKLLNNAEYQIAKLPSFNGNILQIHFSNLTCEEVAVIFQDKINIATIKVYDDSNNILSVLNGYTEEISVELVSGIVIVNLKKEADNIVAEINELKKNDTLMQKQIDNTVAAVDFVLTEGL